MRTKKISKRTPSLIFAFCIPLLFFSILPVLPKILADNSSSQTHDDRSDKEMALSLVILGEPRLDVTQIEPSTVFVSRQETRIEPDFRRVEHKDINGDGLADLVFPLNGDHPGIGFTKGLKLSGSTYNGGSIEGSWYIAGADKRTGVTQVIFASETQTPQAGCTLGPFTRTIDNQPLAGRLIQNGIAASCSATKTCPGTEVAGGQGPFPNGIFDGPRFNMSTSPICVNVTTTALNCSSGVHTTAIVGDHIAFFNMCDGYAGDSGAGTGTNGSTSFSFTVPPGEIYSVVFVEQTLQAQCAQFTYTIGVSPCSILCIQDDTSRDSIRFSSTAGTYEFTSCRYFLTLTGRGTITRRGSVVTLTDYSGGLRVLARFDEAVKKGSATIQYLPLNLSSTIIDRNISDNTCGCP